MAQAAFIRDGIRPLFGRHGGVLSRTPTARNTHRDLDLAVIDEVVTDSANPPVEDKP